MALKVTPHIKIRVSRKLTVDLTERQANKLYAALSEYFSWIDEDPDPGEEDFQEETVVPLNVIGKKAA